MKFSNNIIVIIICIRYKKVFKLEDSTIEFFVLVKVLQETNPKDRLPYANRNMYVELTEKDV